jgi:hypothetical protein
MNDELNKFLNQSINTLNDTEEKEYIFNSNYAGRKINIRIKIDALNKSAETSNTVHSTE